MAVQFLLRGAAALGLTAEPWFVTEKPTNSLITIGVPVASYHNVTLQIYAQVLRDFGHTVNTVTNLEHPKMYKHFTGQDGEKRYIDVVVSSDLPINHRPYLFPYKDTFNVVGTCYETQGIYLAAPSYTNITTLAAVKTAKDINKTLIGFDINPCARCPDFVEEWKKGELGPDFTYHPFSESDLEKELRRKIAAKEVFATTMFAPSKWLKLFPELVHLDMGQFASKLKNEGKALVSTASELVTNPANARTVRALGAVFVGSEELSQLDLNYDKIQKEGGAQADNAAYVVAQQWIKDNKDTYDLFTWR